MPVHLRWGLLLLAAACAPADTDEPVEPGLALGSGELEWLDLQDGGDLEVVRGPQGGYHFLGSVRIKGIEAGDPQDLESPLNPTTRFTATIDGEDLVIIEPFTQVYPAAPASAAPWTHQILGRFVILGINDDDEINGKQVHFFVELTDHEGSRWTDEHDLIVVPNPYNDG